jgi:hypothetical protein
LKASTRLACASLLVLGGLLSAGCSLALGYPEVASEVCDNGVDDDLDGASDCRDTECFATCGERLCADHEDDDHDGAIDCFDSDCFGAACAEIDAALCNDGQDNDADGRPDLAEVTCWPFGTASVTRCAHLTGGAIDAGADPHAWAAIPRNGSWWEAAPDPTGRFPTVLSSRGPLVDSIGQMESLGRAVGELDGTVAHFSVWVSQTPTSDFPWLATVQIARADVPAYLWAGTLALNIGRGLVEIDGGSPDDRIVRVATPTGWYDVTLTIHLEGETFIGTAEVDGPDGEPLVAPLSTTLDWPVAPALALAIGGDGDGRVLIGEARLTRETHAPCDGAPDPSFVDPRFSYFPSGWALRGDELCGLGSQELTTQWTAVALHSVDRGETWDFAVPLEPTRTRPGQAFQLSVGDDGRFLAVALPFDPSGRGTAPGPGDLTFLASDDCATFEELGPVSAALDLPAGYRVLGIAENHAGSPPHRVSLLVRDESGADALYVARADSFAPGAFVFDAELEPLTGAPAADETPRSSRIEWIGGGRLLARFDHHGATISREAADGSWQPAFEPLEPSGVLGAFDATSIFGGTVIEESASADAWHGTFWYDAADAESISNFGWARLTVVRPR